MVAEVKRFEGMNPSDLPCNIIIDKTYLESVEDNVNTGIIGGFKMYAKKGKIVCSQTIDDRIDLCFQAAIPAIREMLFPSMNKARQWTWVYSSWLRQSSIKSEGIDDRPCLTHGSVDYIYEIVIYIICYWYVQALRLFCKSLYHIYTRWKTSVDKLAN